MMGQVRLSVQACAVPAEGGGVGRSGLEEVRRIVPDVQRYCMQDGPGLRTGVFFKGCPL